MAIGDIALTIRDFVLLSQKVWPSIPRRTRRCTESGATDPEGVVFCGDSGPKKPAPAGPVPQRRHPGRRSKRAATDGQVRTAVTSLIVAALDFPGARRKLRTSHTHPAV